MTTGPHTMTKDELLAPDIVDSLTERRKHRFGGDATVPCQKLCLVPHEMLCSAIDEIKRLRARASLTEKE